MLQLVTNFLVRWGSAAVVCLINSKLLYITYSMSCCTMCAQGSDRVGLNTVCRTAAAGANALMMLLLVSC